MTGGVVLAAPGPAFADHTHAKVVGNGQCVVLAEGAGEESVVVLPLSVFENNPNVDIAPTTALDDPSFDRSAPQACVTRISNRVCATRRRRGPGR